MSDALTRLVAYAFQATGRRRLLEEDIVQPLSHERRWFAPSRVRAIVGAAKARGALRTAGAHAFEPSPEARDLVLPFDYRPDPGEIERELAAAPGSASTLPLFRRFLRAISAATQESESDLAAAVNRLQQSYGGLLTAETAAFVLARSRGVAWFMMAFGLSMILGAAFPMDPSDGFPVGTPEGMPASVSTSGIVHFAAGGLGFLSLAVNPIVSIREMGFYSALGIFLSFLLAIVFVPAVLALLRACAENPDLVAAGVWTHFAVAEDPRDPSAPFQLRRFQTVLEELEESGLRPRLLFLEAGEEALLDRFKETRRRHPLAPDGRITDGIRAEREILAPLRERADLVMDTSDLTGAMLRRRIATEMLGPKGPSQLALTILTFGFKNGPPRDADTVRSYLRDELVGILEEPAAKPKGQLWGDVPGARDKPAVVLVVVGVAALELVRGVVAPAGPHGADVRPLEVDAVRAALHPAAVPEAPEDLAAGHGRDRHPLPVAPGGLRDRPLEGGFGLLVLAPEPRGLPLGVVAVEVVVAQNLERLPGRGHGAEAP